MEEAIVFSNSVISLSSSTAATPTGSWSAPKSTGRDTLDSSSFPLIPPFCCCLSGVLGLTSISIETLRECTGGGGLGGGDATVEGLDTGGRPASAPTPAWFAACFWRYFPTALDAANSPR